MSCFFSACVEAVTFAVEVKSACTHSAVSVEVIPVAVYGLPACEFLACCRAVIEPLAALILRQALQAQQSGEPLLRLRRGSDYLWDQTHHRFCR